MRQKNIANGITCAAYSGTTGIMLAFDIQKKLRKNFLGFAIRRTDAKKTAWLQGLLRFEGDESNDFSPRDTQLAPIQKFRWSDYCVYPGNNYEYEIFAVVGNPKKLSYIKGPKIKISTEHIDGTKNEIVFNRAAAASQAYEKKFGNTKPNNVNDPMHSEARKWLARGIDIKILDFINRASNSEFSLDIAIYEFEWQQIAEKLNEISHRGVSIRLLMHGKKNDPQTTINEDTASTLNPKILVSKRTTSKIFHHKYIVLKHNNQAVAILTGSANFTNNALYLQANVVHIINDEMIASDYGKQFETLWNSSDKVKTIKEYNESICPATNYNSQTWFSPKSNITDIEHLKEIITNSKHNFFICSAFDIHPDLENVIKNHPNEKIIRYGLQSSKSTLTGIHRNSEFTIPAFLKEGIGKIFLKESTKRRAGEGSIYIHLKTMIIDFASDKPIVIVGSHNFSKAASLSNDENLFILINDINVADNYMIEMFRLYDHYRFRYNQNESGKSLFLCPDDSWCDPYFDPENKKSIEKNMFILDKR